ncbi:hypothetical protein ACFS32_06605 [Novosphingobium pokkalii]|uniref:hypothetical protein n=1 Tax=Novosphingobium pokkalii TaxID=1770194 RepID=UPI003640F951
MLFAKLLLIMALVGGVLTVAMGVWHVMRRRKDHLKIPMAWRSPRRGCVSLVQRTARGFRRSRPAKAKLNQFVGWLPGGSGTVL